MHCTDSGRKGIYHHAFGNKQMCCLYHSDRRKRAEHPSIVQNDVALYYELQDFRDIYKLDDYERCTQLLAYSRTVMEVYEAARRDAGIVFAADKEWIMSVFENDWIMRQIEGMTDMLGKVLLHREKGEIRVEEGAQ